MVLSGHTAAIWAADMMPEQGFMITGTIYYFSRTSTISYLENHFKPTHEYKLLLWLGMQSC